jgi:hypothetical protein
MRMLDIAMRNSEAVNSTQISTRDLPLAATNPSPPQTPRTALLNSTEVARDAKYGPWSSSLAKKTHTAVNARSSCSVPITKRKPLATRRILDDCRFGVGGSISGVKIMN